MNLQYQSVTVEAGSVTLEGFLNIPEHATAIVIFVHGSGSSRFSPRNQMVADRLADSGLATLLFDLLSEEEEKIDIELGHIRFDIPFLAERVTDTIDWVAHHPKTRGLKIGLIGSSTGAAAAIVSAVARSELVKAVVSRGGRPDLAGNALSKVQAPTLLVVGGRDFPVIELNEQAFLRLNCQKKMELIPYATHLFEEPGTLEEAAHLAQSWFIQHLA